MTSTEQRELDDEVDRAVDSSWPVSFTLSDGGSADRPVEDGLAWVDGLEAALAVLSEDGGRLRLARASLGFRRMFGLETADIAGQRLEQLLKTDASFDLTGVGVLPHPVQFTAILAGPAGPARFGFTLRAARAGERWLVLEATALEQAALADRRRTALFEQTNLINGGALYVDDVDADPGVHLAGLLGFDPAIRKSPPVVRPPTRRASHKAELRDLADGEFAASVHHLRNAKGEWRWIELRERVFSRDADGVPRRVLAFGSDFTERRKMADSLVAASRALFMAETQERRRIARELHDSTAQHLVAIDLSLSGLERRLGADREQRELIRDLRRALYSAQREVRAFSYLLHPPSLERLGLEATLHKFVTGFAARAGLQARLRVRGRGRASKVAGELALFRVAQEALMNVHKHAGATSVDVRLIKSASKVVLEVLDDGVGLTEAQVDRLMAEDIGGVGVPGMRARMEQIGGLLELRSRRSGFMVRATVPTSTADEEARAAVA